MSLETSRRRLIVRTIAVNPTRFWVDPDPSGWHKYILDELIQKRLEYSCEQVPSIRLTAGLYAPPRKSEEAMGTGRTDTRTHARTLPTCNWFVETRHGEANGLPGPEWRRSYIL
ncbi:hypothetical protein SCP_1000250 [Sparassis crispa]|uniref:Uncharacterized protein n=1 Tax=Sparassis crispa TaxID=139825 RepID=A0A401GX67_9APHY|nr:hypothetical protein SCP_1000250 [Sparassis crispa]GBE86783.1 hypothetical protein SCP_1000250 [Sparassis crispa]